MIAVRLGPELRQVAVASPAYIERNGTPDHPRDLVDHRCIRWRWPGRALPYTWEFFDNGDRFEVAVDGPLLVNDKEMSIRAAADGAGIAFPVEYMVAGLVAAEKLIVLLEPWSANSRAIFYAICGNDRWNQLCRHSSMLCERRTLRKYRCSRNFDGETGRPDAKLRRQRLKNVGSRKPESASQWRVWALRSRICAEFGRLTLRIVQLTPRVADAECLSSTTPLIEPIWKFIVGIFGVCCPYCDMACINKSVVRLERKAIARLCDRRPHRL